MATNVREILQGKGPHVHTVNAATSIFEALELMASANVSSVLVLEGERLVGIFTERDYARKVILKGRASRDVKIGEVMTQNLLTVSPSHSVEDIMQMMTENRVRHLPVVERGQLIGIVTIGDAVKAVIDQQQLTIKQLTGYIAGDLST